MVIHSSWCTAFKQNTVISARSLISMLQSRHDSSPIRGSILDVCMQLGALDSNNPIADWMFNDPAFSSQQGDGANLKRHGSWFHERISGESAVGGYSFDAILACRSGVVPPVQLSFEIEIQT
jgi:hypothetical protein